MTGTTTHDTTTDDAQTTTITLTADEVRSVANGDLTVDELIDRRDAGEPLLTRRAAIALGLAGLGSVLGAGGGWLATEAAKGQVSGQLGTSTDPIAEAYLNQIEGTLVNRASRIDTLRPIAIAGDSESISVGPETAVFRYDDS
jgi:hypothetical protein